MKITTNSILILFGMIALALLACLPIAMFASPLLGREQPAPIDPAATIQAMVTQTIVALTQNAPTQTSVPGHCDSCSTDEYACANEHGSSHSDGCFLLRLGHLCQGCYRPGWNLVFSG